MMLVHDMPKTNRFFGGTSWQQLNVISLVTRDTTRQNGMCHSGSGRDSVPQQKTRHYEVNTWSACVSSW